MEIYRQNAGPQSRDTRFVRACAVETHMDISQEPFCMEIYRKNAARAVYHHLDQTPGLNCYHKNPFSVATLFGEQNYSNPDILVCLDHLKSTFNAMFISFFGVSPDFPMFDAKIPAQKTTWMFQVQAKARALPPGLWEDGPSPNQVWDQSSMAP